MNHEDLDREEVIEGSTDRTFGLVFAGVFAVVAFWPLIAGRPLRWWAVAVAAVFALLALVKPLLLAAANRLWTRFGVLLGKVVSPIALGILFYGVLAPLATVLRLVGKDPLRLKRDKASTSYWIARDTPGPPPTSMTQQF
jgi:Saxitoxin biosynthesis operon protein SxtJ